MVDSLSPAGDATTQERLPIEENSKIPAQKSQNASSGMARQGLIYTLATAAPAIATLVVLPILTRTLSRTNFSSVSVSLSVVQVGVVLAALGLGAAITREYILNASGAAGARGLVIYATGINLCIVGLAVATGPLWAPILLGRPWDDSLLMALFCCAGGGLVIVAQAYLRAANRPVVFVLLTLGGTLVGPLIGILAISQVSATATTYLTWLAVGYLLAGFAGLVVVLLDGKPELSWAGLRQALRIGVPTVPHQISLYLAVSGLVIVAERILHNGGEANIILTIGAGTTVITGAFNNAWAPTIYRAPAEERADLLTRTSRQITWLVTALIVCVVAAAPYILSIVAADSYAHDTFLIPLAITALAALPSVIYLANGHLIFVAGRTFLLSITTPASVGIGLALAAVAAPHWGLTAIGVAYIVIYFALALSTTLVQRGVTTTPWRPPIPIAAFGTALVATVALVVLPSGGLWILGRASITAGTLFLVWRAIKHSRSDHAL